MGLLDKITVGMGNQAAPPEVAECDIRLAQLEQQKKEVICRIGTKYVELNTIEAAVGTPYEAVEKKAERRIPVPAPEGLKVNFSGIQQILRKFTRQQLICIGAGAVVVVMILALGIKGMSAKKLDSNTQVHTDFAVQENVQQENQKDAEQKAEDLTLEQQLSLMGEYMDSRQIDKVEELLNTMVEQHVNEPELYLGMAELEIERNHDDAAADMLVNGYQITKDEGIKSKLLELQTRAKVGDEAAEQINRALNLAEDIAGEAGYGDTVEKGKNIFNTVYGYYLESQK